MRAVLDPNVVVSAALSPTGTPATVLRAAREGVFEAIASPLLLQELERVLTYPKLRPYIDSEDEIGLLKWLRSTTTVLDDPIAVPSVRCPDPGDDYLIALAESQRAVIVSGDKHLLGLSGDIPVFTTREFLSLLQDS